MFQVNDTVLYGPDGLCRITAIEQRPLAGKQQSFYELHPLYRPDFTLLLPTDNEKITEKMRPVLTEAEVHDAIRSIEKADCIWIESEKQRKEIYQKIIRGTDHLQLIRLIKTLRIQSSRLQSCGKKLHSADDGFLKKAEKNLFEEFAHVLRIRQDQVLHLIEDELDKTH